MGPETPAWIDVRAGSQSDRGTGRQTGRQRRAEGLETVTCKRDAGLDAFQRGARSRDQTLIVDGVNRSKAFRFTVHARRLIANNLRNA